MAIFNPSSQAKKDTAGQFSAEPPVAPRRDEQPPAAAAGHAQGPARQAPAGTAVKESLIAANLTIEGKIEGTGHVRIAGQFKGDVNVKGDLTIERGARLNGGVRADRVTVAGVLEGNIESAERVELLDSAVLSGDLKAGSLTVSAGSRIRGHIECGWEEKDAGASKAAGGKQDAKSGARSDKADVELVP